MEEAAKSIESLAKHILPVKPHCLSIDPTKRYRPHPDEKRLEEQDFRPLQYKTFISHADRGVTLTRAYFDVREEPVNPHNATSNAPTPRSDPTKPITKLSLKDYKNRAKAPDGESTPKSRAPPNNPIALKPKPLPLPSKHAPEAVAKDMESLGDAKKGTSNSKIEANRRHSPLPETKKRALTRDEDTRPVKRIKGEDATPNAPSVRLLKADPPNKLERKISHEKKPSKDLRPIPGATTNGRSALGNLGNRSASPKSITRVNGSQKSTTSNSTPKKTEGNSHSQTSSVPPLLSPLRIAGLDARSEDPETIRASPKKKIEDNNSTKPPIKKARNDREPSPDPKKRRGIIKIPPLLSPTLPPIVMEELAKVAKTSSSKPSSQKGSQVSDSSQPPSAQKTVKSTKREETIHVESKKEVEKKKEPESFVVTLKYKKRIAKTVERLLALPPGGKRKADGLKREERAARERSDSLEPGVARKRPRTGTEVHPPEAAKRPRTSENPQPSTPLPKQASVMTRVTSSSSLAGTPGTANELTPSTQLPEAKRIPVDFEQVKKLQSKAKTFRELGTRLKHERDALMRNARPPDPELHAAMGAGTQALLAYMLSFKLEADSRDLEQKARFPNPWKDMIRLIRAIKTDCQTHNQLSALLMRIEGICLVYLARALWCYPNQPEAARELLQNSKDQQETWRQAEKARRGLGTYDGSNSSNDGGPVGKLVDRLGPWSSPEDAIPIVIEILRKTIRFNGQWKPADELARWSHSLTNGVPPN